MLDPIGALYDGFQHSNTIEPAAEELGLGASMFLLSLKAQIQLFFCLTLVNLPLLIMYANGSVQLTSGVFFKYSMGNIV